MLTTILYLKRNNVLHTTNSETGKEKKECIIKSSFQGSNKMVNVMKTDKNILSEIIYNFIATINK